MRGDVDVAAGLPPDELYRFFAEDLFRSASPPLREAMFRLALVGIDGARVLLGPKHVALVDEAAEKGFLTGEGRVVHPLFRGFLLAKIRELDDAVVASLIPDAVDWLSLQRRWDDCLFVLQRFPDDPTIIEMLHGGLSEMLDSGRVASVKQWLTLTRERDLLDHPIVLLAEAEVGLRERADSRALALGEEAGRSLSGDLAARAYLVAARAAHLRDIPKEVTRLCALGVENAESAAARVDALWVAFASSIEHTPASAGDILEQLRAASDSRPIYGFRLAIAEGLYVCQGGQVRRAVEILTLAKELMTTVRDPFVRTNFFHHFAYTLILSARYEEAHLAANDALDEGQDAGLEFVIDHALIRQAGSCIGMRKLKQARTAIDRLNHRAASASDYVLAHTVLERIRLAIAAGDLELAHTLLGTQRGSIRPAYLSEVRGYESILFAASGDLDRALDTLGGRADYGCYVEGAALADTTNAIVAIASNDPEQALAILTALFDRGEVDAIVTGYRVYPHIAKVALGTSLEGQMTGLLIRSRDFDVARQIGLKIARELRPREKLSAREQEVYELLIQS
jgi:hypothetical protein